jgi:argininosuccinate synthase
VALDGTAEKAPDQQTYLELTFEKGDPVAINGQAMKAHVLLATLNRLAASTASAASTWSRTATSA